MRTNLLLGATLAIVAAMFSLSALFSVAYSSRYDVSSNTQATFGTSFAYQGQLKKEGVEVNDTCTFQFSLWDAATNGTQVGSTQTISATVSSGLFNLTLNGNDEFGPTAFDGNARYIETGVKCTGDSAFDKLGDRAALSPVPYAHYAAHSSWTGLSGVPTDLSDGDDSVPSGTLIMTELPTPPEGYTSTHRTMTSVEQGVIESIPTPRNQVTWASANGIIYALGGRTSQGIVTTVNAYDPIADMWTQVSSLPTKRLGMAAATINEKIYVFGGYTDDINSPLNLVEVFDIANDTWGAAAPMPTARFGSEIAALDGKIYIISGFSNSFTLVPAIDVYDPVLNIWSSGVTIPYITWPGGEVPFVGTADGKIFVLGYDDTYRNRFLVFTSIANNWSEKTPPPVTIQGGSTMAELNGRLYVFGA